MFTLQILDRGQTFLHPLDNRPAVIGSGAHADLVLREAEVLPEHARLEPSGASWRIVAMGKLLVNGRATQAAELALGDRIEIGRAVLVVGRSVARPGVPEDVLATARRPRAAPASRRSRWLLPAFAAVLMVAVAVMLATMPGGEAARVQAELATLHRILASGDLERGSAVISRLQKEWQGAVDDRLARLDTEQQLATAIRAAMDRQRAEVLDPSIDRSYAQWNLELQRIESEGGPVDRIAARLTRSNLRATLERRPALAAAKNTAANDTTSPSPVTPPPATVAGETASSKPGDASIAAGVTQAARSAATIAAARQLAGQGQYVQAISLLQAEVGEVLDSAVVVELQDQMREVRKAGRRALATLIAEARELMARGLAQQAADLLAGAQPRFAGDPEFQSFDAAQQDAEVAVSAAAQETMRSAVRGLDTSPAQESAQLSAFASLQEQLRKILEAEERAAFADAAALLREGAAMVREADADFAARLVARAAEAEQLAAWHQSIGQRLQAGWSFEVALLSGQVATLTTAEGPQLVGRSSSGDVKVSWYDIAPAGLLTIADRMLAEEGSVAEQAVLGVATLFYRNGEARRAEAELAKLLRKAPGLKATVDVVIARGRSEPVDPRGYELGKDGFVSVRAIEAQKQAQKLVSRLDGLLRGKDQVTRNLFVREALAEGPDALAALAAAFQKEWKAQLARLGTSPLKKQLARLDAQRKELDRAREHAKALIYDEVEYFYPYKPPAVSSDRFAQYSRVQAEVDRRVAALRTLWREDGLRVKIPASLRGDLERLDWVAKVLGDLGQLDASAEAEVEWARALPAGDSIGIAEYCRTRAEREELEEWRGIEAVNQVAQKQLGSSAREQLNITNAYRAMFRHRPLAVSASLCAASSGHAEEMSRLGYFSHTSPTPGRGTPYERMRLAGYNFGASENIALNDSASSAHDAWCRSSGHHRNLLNPRHREFGIGVDGHYWVQTFGSGRTYEQHAAWTGPSGASRATRPGRR